MLKDLLKLLPKEGDFPTELGIMDEIHALYSDSFWGTNRAETGPN